MSEESLMEIINSYLAIEGPIASRYISEKTRHEASETLEALDKLFAEELREHYEHNDHDHQSNQAA